MREILFRGKDIAGNWHYGVPLVFTDDYVCITAPHTYNKAVILETVGQFTGLTDKSGKKIFEGDIVKHFNNSDKEYDIGVIYFDTEFMGWRRTTQGRFHKTIIDTYKLNPTCIYEVIGNIHDNPELLKEGADNG